MEMNFGELERIEPRQIWRREDSDFTPWLARPENLRRLGNAVGIEMELERTEVSVGTFFADMLATDTQTGLRIIIENQIEKSDHDHLGKLLTYAAILDVATVLWITTRFTEEHLRTLDWLNSHTSDEIAFYGVEFELLRIGDSLPAIQFNVVSHPNEMVRRTAVALTENISEPKRQQLAFWTKFSVKLRDVGEFSVQNPRPQNWFNVSLGKTGIYLANICNTWDCFVGVRVYISGKIANAMLPYLESRKSEIESVIGETLSWNPSPEKQDKVILLKRPIDFGNPADINEAVDWMVEYTLLFRKAFSKIISEMPEAIIDSGGNSADEIIDDTMVGMDSSPNGENG